MIKVIKSDIGKIFTCRIFQGIDRIIYEINTDKLLFFHLNSHHTDIEDHSRTVISFQRFSLATLLERCVRLLTVIRQRHAEYRYRVSSKAVV